MKKATKLLSLLLAGLLLASCSNAAGGQNETSPADTVALPSSSESAVESESETTYIPDDLPDEDFGDYAFRILSCYFIGRELATYMTNDELTGVPVDDALYYSKINLEDRFNIGISWIETGNETAGLNAAKNSINSGDDDFDILIGHDGNTVGLGKSGMLRNLYDFPEFNFEKPWWTKNAVESWTLGGKLFAASSYISYCGIHWTRAMVVNKDWADDIQMEIPYEAVREGKWTLDMLNALTEDVSYDVDGNGKMTEDDKFGFASGTQTWYCLQEAVDLPMYRRDDDGNVYLDLDVDRADKLLEIMRTLTTPDRYYSVGDFGTAVFQKGNALFDYIQIGDAYDILRTSDVRYGFLPTPKLDETQENYINCCTDVPWAIPKTVSGKRDHIIATICEAMSCYNYNNVLPLYLEGTLKSRSADTADDSEMLQLIADTRVIGFAYGYGLPMNNILSDIMNTSQGAASYFKAKEKLATKLLKKIVREIEEME